MYCRQCGEKVSDFDRNCPRCDAPLESASPGPAAAKKNSAKKAEPALKSEEKSGITLSFSTALILGVVIIAAFLFFAVRNSPPEQAAAPQAATDIQWSPQVLAVAGHFICQCGECDYNLVQCVCPKPKGAVEMKTFIRDGLQAGKTQAQMITAVARKYNVTPLPQTN